MAKIFHFKEKICPHCNELVAVTDLQKVVDHHKYKWYELKPPQNIVCPKCSGGINYNSGKLFFLLVIFFTSIPNIIFNGFNQWQQLIANNPINFYSSILFVFIMSYLIISNIYEDIFSKKFKKLPQKQ